MNKFSISFISFMILIIIFANGFSSAYTSRKIDNIAYILALGIDKGENSKIKISAQFTKSSSFSSTSGGSEEDSSNIILISSESNSVFGALNLLNSYIGKEVNLSHCNLYVFSADFAKQRDLIRNLQFN